MIRKSILGLLYLSLIFLISCQTESDNLEIPMPEGSVRDNVMIELDEAEYKDRILGAIVGSAIGDAMGASTEMWHRSGIQDQYGYINGLTTALRDKSAEGTWQHNMVAGATTDDTRWKVLMGNYFEAYRNQLSTDNFASFISDYYQEKVEQLADKETKGSTDILDERIEQMNWIKEWARVTMAYQEGSASFMKAQHRFYGGEMSCAGMLYSPMFGLIEGSAEAAYITAVDHALFDLGYARDITGLVAALTNKALQSNNIDTLLAIHQYIDPYAYKDSRLIGRLPVAMLEEASSIISESNKRTYEVDASLTIPKNYPGTKEDWLRQDYIYSELEKRQKAIAFHAGEIWQILVTGLMFGEGDFQKTVAFIVNYGRDNDTVAAVAGMIMGAAVGYENLPKEMKVEVLKINKEVLGLDLEALAEKVSKDKLLK